MHRRGNTIFAFIEECDHFIDQLNTLQEKMNRKLISCAVLFTVFGRQAMAQEAVTAKRMAPEQPRSELRLNLTADGSKYIKATILNQTWIRFNQSNPGTMVNDMTRDNTFDIGLRRTRMQLYGQLSDHVSFYMQYGMNNFNFLAQNAGNRKLSAFMHDMLGEFKVFKNNDQLKIGSGLTIVSGLSRFSQPSIGTIMTTDVPVFLQTTVDQTDEFGRKLSLYARGQLGKFDYRVAISDPFAIQTNGAAVPAIGSAATFNPKGHSYQYGGFLMYNFLDKESHVTPYMTGTYLGDKKVLNLEGGFIYQKNATWYLDGADTVYDNLLMWSLAAFADMPVKSNKYSISAYAGYFFTDYGHNYIRNNGIMNPANGNNDPVNFNGAGNAYPMFGTGSSIYAQAGFRLPNGMLGKLGTLMPYASYRYSRFDKLADAAHVYNAGVNWLINKHQSKVSLNYELRPLFRTQLNGDISSNGYRNSVWLQYQIFF